MPAIYYIFLHTNKIYIYIQNAFCQGWQAEKIKRMKKEEIVVSMTGFGTDQHEQEYKAMIQNLNMRFAPTMSEVTNILIAKSVATEKYKIAKTFQKPIICVKVQWLIQSKDRGQILQPKHYEIDKLFYGLEIKLLSLSQQKIYKIKTMMQTEGGFAEVINNVRDYCKILQEGKDVQVIITEKQKIPKLKFEFYLIKHPIVCIQWFEYSLLRKVCKFPIDYSYNQEYLIYRRSTEHVSKMKYKLQQFLIESRQKHLEKVSSIFQNIFIYFHINVNKELSDVLKKIIILNGGFYLQNTNAVTHIITELIPENQYHSLCESGLLVQVVRIQWLLDCIYLNKRINEEDYYIRSFKTNFGLKANHSLQELQRSMQSSNSESKSDFFSCTLARNLSSNNYKKSISLRISDAKQQPKQKSRVKYGSSIFEGYFFYIESSHRSYSQIKNIHLQIMKHKGEVFSSRANIISSSCYYVLTDCEQYINIVQRLTKDLVKHKTKIIPVSYRWVKQCITKITFIDLNKAQSYVYKPFNFRTPLKGFHKLVFEVIGLQSVQKLRLKQLYNALGSLKNMPNKIEVTHCLCGDYFSLIPKYDQLKKENPQVVFLRWGWLLQCANKGRIVETNEFLCEEGKKNQIKCQDKINQQKEQIALNNVIKLDKKDRI